MRFKGLSGTTCVLLACLAACDDGGDATAADAAGMAGEGGEGGAGAGGAGGEGGVGGEGGAGGAAGEGGAGGAAGMGGPLDERAGIVLPDEGFGDGATRLVYLDQGWNPAETLWYYHADQGSTLIPHRVLIHLEQATSDQRFLDPAFMTRLRFLPQRPGPTNPDGLPVGFARHDDQVGLTCAACHTTQLQYGDVAIRIDGAPALADVDGLLEALEAAMEATLADEAKRTRYLDAASAGPPPGREARRAEAQAELEAALAWMQSYNLANHSTTTEGFGRMDAVGRIVNQVIRMTSGPENSLEPNAPNSMPFLWDAPRHDYVQWAGFSPNADVGSLVRNTGEVIGVFARVEVEGYDDESDRLKPYDSTINGQNLVDMEAQLWHLQSPVWPEDILPPIDRALAERGAAIYQAECADCHALLDRTDEARRVRAQMYGFAQIGTDPTSALNFVSAVAPTGVLEGSVKTDGGRFGAQDSALALLSTLISRSLTGQPTALAAAARYAMIYDLQAMDRQGEFPESTEEAPNAHLLAYKARPLNGIWATAPYLHNGSVPSLYDLLLPEAERPVTFSVGRRLIDPVKVGPSQEGEAPFVVDTRLPGNRNTGHLAGTDLADADRWALVEYLKTL